MNSLFWIGIALLLWYVVMKIKEKVQKTKIMRAIEQQRAKELVEHLRSVIPDFNSKGWVKFAPIIFCLFFGFIVFGFTHQHQYPIEVHHQVYVWSKVKGTNDAWWVSSEDGLPYSRWNCCPDFDCKSVIWPGYIAATAKYEERGTCKSIRADGLGWFWSTNELGDVKEIQ